MTTAHEQAATVVLGGSGFLGAHVVARAVARAQAEATFAEPLGPPVLGVARRPSEAPLFSSPRDAARWRAADLSLPDQARAVLDAAAPRVVLNCAALARAAACDEDPVLAERFNTLVPEEVAAWCAEHGARLVHVSTDLVFGGRPPARPSGFREGDPVDPVSLYGRTKAAGEARVLAADPSALVVRLPLLYGNSGGRGLGASDSLLEAVDRDLAPPLFTDEFRTPLEVSNAAEALVELAHGSERGLLHVAGPERVSRHALGLAVLEAMGLERAAAAECVRAVRREEVPGAGARPEDTSLDASRARGLLACALEGLGPGLERALR